MFLKQIFPIKCYWYKLCLIKFYGRHICFKDLKNYFQTKTIMSHPQSFLNAFIAFVLMFIICCDFDFVFSCGILYFTIDKMERTYHRCLQTPTGHLISFYIHFVHIFRQVICPSILSRLIADFLFHFLSEPYKILNSLNELRIILVQ